MIGRDAAARDLRFESSLTDDDSNAPVRTLVVDDDVEVKEVFTAILSAEGYEVSGASSAEEALELLALQSFDVMLADIRMPGMDGFELLQHVHHISPDLPVIFISGNATVETARRALKVGACDIVAKPCNLAELPIIVERNLARQALARRRMLRYRSEIQDSYETVLAALLSALDTRDTETEGHSERVTAYTMLLADLMGVPPDQCYHIERGALLHDIGKIGVPDRILLKPGPLTPEEFAEMQQHPVIGFRMCARIDFLRGAAQIVLHHHERWDGAGYPDGLAGEQIPLGARIFAVVDAFDAMTTDRPYRLAFPFEYAREEIRGNFGTQFDPQVVEVFLTVPETRWQQIREMSGR
jgi:putative nucleotidyltransferase with HDIG domain